MALRNERPTDLERYYRLECRVGDQLCAGAIAGRPVAMARRMQLPFGMATYCATVIGPTGAFINSHSHWVKAKAIAYAVDQANQRQGYGLGPHRVELRTLNPGDDRYSPWPSEVLESYAPVHIVFNDQGYGLPKYDQ